MEEQTIVPENNAVSADVQSKKSHKKIIAGAAVLVVVAAGIFAYTVYAAPARVWQKFLSMSLNGEVAQEKFSFSYVDNGTVDDSVKNSAYASYFTKVKASAHGTAYANATNAENPEMSLDMNYTLASGDTSFGSRLQMRAKDQVLYINLGNSPLISGIMGMVSPGQPVEWIKLDIKKMQALASTPSSSPASTVDFSAQVKDYKLIVEKHWGKLVTIEKVLGREKVDGVQTIHYANKVNKEELKGLIFEVFDYAMKTAVSASGGEITEENIAQTKKIMTRVVNNLVDRMDVQTFETWVGVSDFRLRRVKIQTTAPSLASLASIGMSDMDSNKTEEEIIDDVFARLSFAGVITIEEEFSDYGKVMPIEIPTTGVLDMSAKMEEMKAMQSTPYDSGTDDAQLMQ